MKKKLEKLMYMGLGALIAFGGYLFGTLHSDNVDAQLALTDVEYNEIRCRNLTIVDADGKTLLTLGSNLDGGEVSIYEGNGKLRARLGVDYIGNVSYTDGRLEHIRRGIVSIYGENEKVVASLGARSYSGNLSVNSESGKSGVHLGTDVEDGAFISAHSNFDLDNLESSIHAELRASPSRGGSVAVTGNAKQKVVLSVNDYGGLMAIFNESGENVLQTSVNNAGDGTILTWDQFGDNTGGFPEGKKVKIMKRLR